MGKFTSRLIATALAVVILSIGVSGTVSADEGALAYRKAVMGAIGGHMKSMVAIIKGQVPFKEHLRGHAHGMAELAKLSIHIFPKGSDVGKTTISPAVWEKPAEFEKAKMAFVQASADLAKAADSGDMGAFTKKFGPLGGSCKGCHTNFRIKK
jgi:cytochrome c556